MTTSTVDIPEPALARLSKRLDGRLIRPLDPAYAAARAVWNGMIDRYPAVIARCAGTDDVVAALAFGQELGLPIAVRGGGHSIAGFGTCDSGLVVDLSGIRDVAVDPVAGLAD